MERFKESVVYGLYLRAFKGNYLEMANLISRLRSEDRAKGGQGFFDLKDLDKYLQDKENKI